jgi:hypothetical protein
MNVKRNLFVCENQWWGEESIWEEWRESKYYTHTHTHTHTHTLLEKRGRRREDWECNVSLGANLFKGHSTQVWNYHNETPYIINVC